MRWWTRLEINANGSVSGGDGAVNTQHILICFHDFPRGGTERVAMRLARHWLDAGREVTILCGTEAGAARGDVDPRIRVVALDPPIVRSPLSRLRLGRAMAAVVPALAPDIIFLPGNFHLWLAPALARVKARARIVAKLSNPALPKGLLAVPLRYLLRRYADAVDGLATMNSGLERDVAALLPGMPVRTLFDPVYLDHAPVVRAPVADAPMAVLWAGRLEPQKDVALALRVIAAVNRRTPAKLTILGDGSGNRAMHRAIAAARLNAVVATPGHVAAIDPYLARADALLITSRFEGGPAVAVEALAHGVPVVATDCSYFLQDIMVRPEAGRIVASRDPQALAEALLSVRAAGRPDPAVLAELVAHLDPQACADAYLAWFDAIGDAA